MHRGAWQQERDVEEETLSLIKLICFQSAGGVKKNAIVKTFRQFLNDVTAVQSSEQFTKLKSDH